jgi:hypothetical protein
VSFHYARVCGAVGAHYDLQFDNKFIEELRADSNGALWALQTGTRDELAAPHQSTEVGASERNERQTGGEDKLGAVATAHIS